MRKLLFLLTSIGFLVAGVLLGLLNNQLVDFDIYFYQLQLPLAILLGLIFFLGLVFAFIFSFYQLVILRYRLRQAKRTIAKQMDDIVELKSKLSQQQTKLEAQVAQSNAAVDNKLEVPALPNSNQ